MSEQQIPQQDLTEQEAAQKLSEVLQIRRDKLDALKQSGQNPFEITTYHRTAYAKQIVEAFEQYEGKIVSVA